VLLMDKAGRKSKYESTSPSKPPHSDVGPDEGQAAESPPVLERVIEALLFIGGAALNIERASCAIRGLTSNQLLRSIKNLELEYRRQGRPYTIQAQDAGFVLTLLGRYQPVVERLYGQNREARLSQPAIEALSLVAYRQPVTKHEIDAIRGADSGALLRQLVRRGLVSIAQRPEKGSRGVSYGTTQRFLELFKLKSLDDLPQTKDLQML
jgi:segregation and condensation protein B